MKLTFSMEAKNVGWVSLPRPNTAASSVGFRYRSTQPTYSELVISFIVVFIR
ncbi:MAG: hypothetical protein F6K25_15965 [Okeania sp. SIO2G4]|uniref:hypothetical protein n=1 Tax=Okeania sp. SIO2G5 TaxID=2607796 RepID=UPI0013B8E680|nr:hypothetical protein [Okeania sp. SIO2G5]NEP06967.1 hypothetical protein [Okeania sp. SIO4D6]NEP73689.1 hypothetical protein [Okeania sp. SIO2G5]NEP94491.1 hypothetical protein [Okeania sp. SIO2F5]NEQ92112.1 hypothetical protein [Okeania sp. SIO2G4]